MLELDKGLGESELFGVYFSSNAEGRDTEAGRLLPWAGDEEMNPSKALQDAMAMTQFGTKWH